MWEDLFAIIGICTNIATEIGQEINSDFHDRVTESVQRWDWTLIAFLVVLTVVVILWYIVPHSVVPHCEFKRSIDSSLTKYDVSASLTLIGLEYSDEIHIPGCLNDIRSLSPIYQNLIGDVCDTTDCCVLHDQKCITEKEFKKANNFQKGTKQNILNRLDKLIEKTKNNPKKHHLHVLHYSGHGIGVLAVDKNEVDGNDECIVPADYDGTQGSLISDNCLRSKLVQFPPNCTIVWIFDCCYSGTVLDTRFNYTSNPSQSSDPTFLDVLYERLRDLIMMFRIPALGEQTPEEQKVPFRLETVNVSGEQMRATIISFSSAQDDTASVAIGEKGILSEHIEEMWKENNLRKQPLDSFLERFQERVNKNKYMNTPNQRCGMQFENLPSTQKIGTFTPFDFKSLLRIN